MNLRVQLNNFEILLVCPQFFPCFHKFLQMCAFQYAEMHMYVWEQLHICLHMEDRGQSQLFIFRLQQPHHQKGSLDGLELKKEAMIAFLQPPGFCFACSGMASTHHHTWNVLSGFRESNSGQIFCLGINLPTDPDPVIFFLSLYAK